METLIDDVEAVLTSIEQGGMLDAVPEDADDRRMHNAACQMLSLLQRRAADVQASGCIDLGGALRTLASDFSCGSVVWTKM